MANSEKLASTSGEVDEGRARRPDALHDAARDDVYRALFDSAPEPQIAFNGELRIVLANAAALQLLGSPKELIGSPVTRFIPGFPALAALEPVTADAAEQRRKANDKQRGTPARTLELSAVADPDQHFSVEISVARVQGMPTPLWCCTLRDITDRKQTEQHFYGSQKMEAIGRLAGGVAHDFNNLLTIIAGHTELLLDELGPSDPLREEVSEIKKAADRAAILTQQLLAFGRRQVLAPQLLDLNAAIENLQPTLQRALGDRIELRIAREPCLAPVKADLQQIEQVILNIAFNARDVMPEGGVLTITTSNREIAGGLPSGPAISPGSYVALSISDTGPRLDPETRSEIFEPFFSAKKKTRGSGMGLATAYGIVRQSGGYIWADAESGGATFHIYLPRAEERIPARPQPQPVAAPPQERAAETVLLVEDEEGVRWLARAVLQLNGYRVLEARDGNEALAICRTHQTPIDLILTDVVMPQMSGRELADQAKRLHPEANVLFMSGYADNVIVRQNMDTAFLQKPFTGESLARKVREVLDTRSNAA